MTKGSSAGSPVPPELIGPHAGGSFVSTGAATAFLLDHLGRDVRNVAFIGAGQWSRCFGYEHGDDHFVIRFGKHVDDFIRDKIAASYRSVFLPIPVVLEIGEALGTYYAISTRAYGGPLEQLSERDWEATLPSTLAVLGALRAADITRTSGYGIWDHTGNAKYNSWREYLLAADFDDPDKRTHGWKQALTDSAIGLTSHQRGVELIDAVTAQMPEPPRALIHNDMLNRNVSVQNNSITGVYDWGCSIYGDPLYELAAIEFWKPWYRTIERSNVVSLAKGRFQDWHFEERLRVCAAHIGISHLGYVAFIGDESNLHRINTRLADFL